jgi:hypothetical protein
VICEDPEEPTPDTFICAVSKAICPDAYFLPGMVTYWVDKEKTRCSQDVLRILFKYRGIISKRSNGVYIPNSAQVPSGVFSLWKKYFTLTDLTDNWFTIMLQDSDPFVIQEAPSLINVGIILSARPEHLSDEGEIIHPESAIVLLGLRHKEPDIYKE